MSLRRRVRPESALGRSGPTRRPRESILIVCEGTKTEPNYFETLCRELGLGTVNVEIVGEGAGIVRVVDETIRRVNERAAEAEESSQRAPFDEAWCVVDTERRNDNRSWDRGVGRATAKGLRLAWSNPCFEYWLLLHFELIGQSFNGYSAIRPAVRRHIRHYEKSADYFEQLAPRVPTAIEHSKRIHRAQWQHTPKPIDCNPATTVHELVERLLEVAGITVAQYQARHPPAEPEKPKGKRSRGS
jgi:hypothetical protein